MKFKSTRGLMLATTIISGFAVAAPAFAQTTPSTAPVAAPEATEIVVVTGSRIRRPDLVASSPVTTIGAAELSKVNVVNLEGQLRALPQFITGRSQFDNNSGNGTPGTATVNLRGLGTVRTLVLMDGKRMTPFGPTGVVDINQVPLALIERVDIVTGGASAVYGSDAIAGVVNFITKQNFEGLQFDATGTQYTEGDGLTQQYQLTMGSSLADDKGNITLSLGYANREAVLQGDREYSTYNLDPSFYGLPMTDPSRRIGSSNAAATRFAYTGAPAASGFTGNRWFAPDGSIVTAAGLPAGIGGARNSSFNYNPYNYFQTPQERYQATVIGRYQVSENIEAYAKAMFNSSTVPTQLAPSAYFGGSTTDFRVNLDNPFLSAAARTTLIGYYNALNPTAPYNAAAAPGSQTVPVVGIRRRLIERGNRNGVGDSTTFQMISGLSGELAAGWSWDISGSYGESKLNSGTTGDISVARAKQALIAVGTPGAAVCLNPANGCAPINIFSGSGGIDPTTGLAATGVVSAAGIDFISADYFASQRTTQQIVTASVSGPLGEKVKSPFADSEISIALGLEYRRDTFVYRPDDLTSTGGAMGQGGTSPFQEGYGSQREVFGEMFIPVVTGKPFAENLSFELGARHTNSDAAGDFVSWKVGGDWTPVSGVRFRGMFQSAVRAPNLDELYAPQASGLTGLTVDPCAGAGPIGNAARTAVCLAQGAPAGRLGFIDQPAAGQAASLTGGAITLGSSLEPEEADTITLGAVFTPVRGFSATLDYYKVDLTGRIATLPTAFVVNSCFVSNQPGFCNLITRNTTTGNLEGNGVGIKLAPGNIGALITEGVDYSANYQLDLDFAKVDFSLVGTHYIKSDSQPIIGADFVKCAGKYGDFCGEPTPTDKFTFRTAVSFGDFEFGATVRHIGKVSTDSTVPAETYEVQSIKAFNYLDLNVRYEINSTMTFNVNVSNVLDKDPPLTGDYAITATNTSMGTFANTYDPLGPQVGIGFSAKF